MAEAHEQHQATQTPPDLRAFMRTVEPEPELHQPHHFQHPPYYPEHHQYHPEYHQYYPEWDRPPYPYQYGMPARYGMGHQPHQYDLNFDNPRVVEIIHRGPRVMEPNPRFVEEPDTHVDPDVAQAARQRVPSVVVDQADNRRQERDPREGENDGVNPRADEKVDDQRGYEEPGQNRFYQNLREGRGENEGSRRGARRNQRRHRSEGNNLRHSPRRVRRADEGMARDDQLDALKEQVRQLARQVEGANHQNELSGGPLHPRLYAQPAPRKWVMPTITPFSGTGSSNAEMFIFGFEEKMRMINAPGYMMCRSFALCLEGIAWEWYLRLPPGSITAFTELSRAFTERFAGISGPTLDVEALLNLTQDKRETTRHFLERFAATAIKVRNYSDSIALVAVKRGLCTTGIPGKLRFDAGNRSFRTLKDFMDFAQGYLRGEDDARNNKQGSPEYSPKRYRDERPKKEKVTGADKYRLKIHDDRAPPPRAIYQAETQFTLPPEEILRRIRNWTELRVPPQHMVNEVKRTDKFCEFHNSSGHNTRDCVTLREELERLARLGKLFAFMHGQYQPGEGKNVKANEWRREGRPQPRDINRRDTPQPLNARPGDDRGRNEKPDIPGRAVNLISHYPSLVGVISGGPSFGGDTSKGRRRYATSLKYEQVNQVGKGRERTKLELKFTDEDEEGVVYPHDDPIVLKLNIGGYTVRRVLVDNGSSANILFAPAFEQMGYERKHLLPVRTPLVGFSGETVAPLGTIPLMVEFGTYPRITSRMTDFLVIDAPGAYNVILGRGALNDIQAVASTYHLMIKFPTEKGVGVEKGIQATAKECNTAAVRCKSRGETLRIGN